jgi:hypothetical protein
MENPRKFCEQFMNFADTVYGIIEWGTHDGNLHKQKTVAIMIQMTSVFVVKEWSTNRNQLYVMLNSTKC